jgi:hypothetical protein
MRTNDLVFFRPRDDEIEVVVVLGGEVTLVPWTREVALGQVLNLLKLIVEIENG